MNLVAPNLQREVSRVSVPAYGAFVKVVQGTKFVVTNHAARRMRQRFGWSQLEAKSRVLWAANAIMEGKATAALGGAIEVPDEVARYRFKRKRGVMVLLTVCKRYSVPVGEVSADPNEW